MYEIRLYNKDDSKHYFRVCEGEGLDKLMRIAGYLEACLPMYEATVLASDSRIVHSYNITDDTCLENVSIALSRNILDINHEIWSKCVKVSNVEMVNFYSSNYSEVTFPLRKLSFYTENRIDEKLAHVMTTYKEYNLSEDELFGLEVENLKHLLEES